MRTSELYSGKQRTEKKNLKLAQERERERNGEREKRIITAFCSCPSAPD